MEKNLLEFSVDYLFDLYNNKSSMGTYFNLLKKRLINEYKGIHPFYADTVSVIITNNFDNYLHGERNGSLGHEDKSRLIEMIRERSGDYCDVIEYK